MVNFKIFIQLERRLYRFLNNIFKSLMILKELYLKREFY